MPLKPAQQIDQTTGEVTFLVTRRETVDGIKGLCPRVSPRLIINLNDPTQHAWAGCRSYVCEICGPIKAKKHALAAAWVCGQQPRTRFITLTQAPEDWQTRRQRVRDLARWVRAQGWTSEWAWATEPNPKGTGYHIHMVQHGDFIPAMKLLDRWGSRVEIKQVRGKPGNVTHYISKGVIKSAYYLAKGTQVDYEAHISLNGGRAWHSSRGFYLGKGWEATYKEARSHLKPTMGNAWQVVEPAIQFEWLRLWHEAGHNRDVHALLVAKAELFRPQSNSGAQD